MLFQVVGSQPSERWTGEMRNSLMWPLKGSATPLACRPMPRGFELSEMAAVSLMCATRGAVQIETSIVGPRVLVIGADDIAPAPFPSVPPDHSQPRRLRVEMRPHGGGEGLGHGSGERLERGEGRNQASGLSSTSG
jgi:hypothetical protein